MRGLERFSDKRGASLPVLTFSTFGLDPGYEERRQLGCLEDLTSIRMTFDCEYVASRLGQIRLVSADSRLGVTINDNAVLDN